MCKYLPVAIEHRMVHFRLDDPSELIAEIEAIADRANGREWVTVSPWVDPEHLPVVSVLRRLFSARASKVPEVTWVPASGDQPAQLGVLHGTGPGALKRLVEAGVAPPDQWRPIQDHSKRGVLFSLPTPASAATIVDFSVTIATILAEVPVDDRWIGQISSSAA